MAVDWTIIFPLIVGGLITFQGATSTVLGRIGGPAFATWFVFTVSILPALILFLVETKAGATVNFAQSAANAPWFSYFGGFMGPFVVWSVLTCVPEIGVNLCFSIQVSAQLFNALLSQHFGIIGVVKRDTSVGMIVGFSMTVAGVVVILIARLRTTQLVPLQDAESVTRAINAPETTPESIEFLATDDSLVPDSLEKEQRQNEAPPKPVAVSLLRYGFCILISVLSGMGESMQAGMNSTLGMHYGSAGFATLVVACVSFVPCSIAFAVEYVRRPTNFRKFRAETPWWCYPCGFVGFAVATMFSYLPQRLDSSVLMGAFVCAQVLSSLAADHFGWMELAVSRVTIMKAFGATLLIGGVIVMSVLN
ncbi:hypothetical protein CcCBS67573_g02679 [Chytriomyces confervae]|uniref:EamA domain-containing protein n=1 Tax=Chytriomyces confervae TaxID=246404 RepID=A0A507FI22_9FUNG|nr:hypothetical protein CcCBS67573_g02679 [Chytriomyces confervae]